MPLEHGVPEAIQLGASGLIVRGSIQFDRQSQFVAKEIDNEAVQGPLSPELQASQTAIP